MKNLRLVSDLYRQHSIVQATFSFDLKRPAFKYLLDAKIVTVCFVAQYLPKWCVLYHLNNEIRKINTIRVCIQSSSCVLYNQPHILALSVLPTLKAIHICNSPQPTHKPKIAKEYVFANASKFAKKSKKTQQCIKIIAV